MIKWGGSALAIGMMVSGAQAQESQLSNEKDEIIVTGSKRGAQNIQNIPYNISAIGALVLEQTNADSIDDVARLTPGLVVKDRGPSNKNIGIRGLAGRRQVSLYMDEIQLDSGRGNVQNGDLGLYDIERIEVLRGPQGTLYGAGGQGGTVRYIARKPNDQSFEASGRADVGFRSRGQGETTSISGMVNVPVVNDVFALRAVGYYSKDGGFIERPDLGFEDTNSVDVYGGRVSGSIQLGEGTKLLATAFYQDTDVGDSDKVNVNPAKADIQSGVVLEEYFDKTTMFNATLEHELGWGTLTATASHTKRDTKFIFDVSQFLPPGLFGRVFQTGPNKIFSSEVRVASNLDGPIQFVGGLFYSESDLDFIVIASTVDPATGIVFPAGSPREFIFDQNTRSDGTTNKAAFGEVTYQVNEQLSVIGGVRLFELTSRSQPTIIASFFGNPLGLGRLDLYDSGTKAAFKAQANYQWADNLLTYVTFSQGFREGGANQPNLKRVDGTDAPAVFDPDFVDNYEFGWKFQTEDHQLTLNGAIYYMDFRDIQVGVTDLTRAFGFTENGDTAALKGVEIDLMWKPDVVDGFSARAGMNLSSQKLTADSLAVGKDGDSLAGTPGFTANAVLQQEFKMGNFDSFVNVNGTYESTSFDQVDRTDPLARETGGYALFGAQFGVKGEGWKASIYARNIFDVDQPVGFIVQRRPGLPDSVIRERARTIGVTLDFDM